MLLSNRKEPSFRIFLCVALVIAQIGTALLQAPAAAASDAVPTVTDVALDSAGVLRGQIVTREGRAAGGTPIVLFQNGHPVARTEADDAGDFAVGKLRGGVYLVAAPGGGQICRAWAPGTAPPAANREVLVVTKAPVVRGQVFRPNSLYEWFETHPVLGYTAVTAAIALPIILITDDDDSAS